MVKQLKTVNMDCDMVILALYLDEEIAQLQMVLVEKAQSLGVTWLL